MTREDYIETVVINGHMVNIGNDDYGQSYYCEFVGKDGTLVEYGCGTYNFDYMPAIEYFVENEFEDNIVADME